MLASTPISTSANLVNNLEGRFAVVRPIFARNLIPNPSFARNSTYWEIFGSATLTIFGPGQPLSASSYKDNGGALVRMDNTSPSANTAGVLGTFTSIAGKVHYGSIYVKPERDLTFRIAFFTSGSAVIAGSERTMLIPANKWTRLWTSFTETTAQTRKLGITLLSSAGVPFNWSADAACVEVDRLTTYFDGNSSSFLPKGYLWEGAMHGSPSIRLANERSGGVVEYLDELGINILAVQGAGLSGTAPSMSVSPLTDSIVTDSAIKVMRTLTLAVDMDGYTVEQVRQLRATVYDRFLPDKRNAQPTMVKFFPTRNGYLLPYGEVDIPCVYAGGLEGSNSSPVSEQAAIKLQLADKGGFFFGADGCAVTTLTNRANDSFIIRTPFGQHVITSITGGVVQDTLITRGGVIYVTGTFTQFDGVANTAGIARIQIMGDGTYLVTALGTGLAGGSGSCLAEDATGNILVGGNFTGAGGVATTAVLARWNTLALAWERVSTGVTNGTVLAIAFMSGTAPKIYVGGTGITSVGGVAVGNFAWGNYAAYADTTFQAGPTITGGQVNAIEVDPISRRVYVGGSFTSPINYFGEFIETTTLQAIISVPNGVVEDLAVNNGTLCITGRFTSIGGLTVSAACLYKNGQYFVMGSGITVGVAPVINVSPYKNGFVLAGDFSAVVGLPSTRGSAIWLGSSFTSFDFWTLTGNNTPVRHHPELEYTAYRLRINPTPQPVCETLMVTNNGDDTVLRAAIEFYAITALRYIGNLTTGEFIYFRGTQFPRGVNMRLVLKEGILRAVNDVGDAMDTEILPGSSPQITLRNGSNALVFSGGDVSNPMEFRVFWDTLYETLDEAIVA